MLAQNDPEGAPEENGPPKETPKPTSKLVRVMTVMAYLMSVSMAAILLSIYYLCIWKSPVLSDLDMEDDLHQQGEQHHLQGDIFEYQRAYEYVNNDSVPYNFTGGSSTTINDTDIQLPPSSVTHPEEHYPNETNFDSTVTEPILYNSTLPHNSNNGTTEVEEDTSVQSSSVATTDENTSTTYNNI